MENFVLREMREIFRTASCGKIFVWLITAMPIIATAMIAIACAAVFSTPSQTAIISHTGQHSSSQQSCIASAETKMSENCTATKNTTATAREITRFNFAVIIACIIDIKITK